MKSYKVLDIYTIGMELFHKTHALSLQLPKYEFYESGSQIRRSSDAVVTNIVEGYGRRRYKNDFIKFLVYSHASNLETLNHIDKIVNLYPNLGDEMKQLHEKYDALGAKIFSFLKYAEEYWKI